MCRRDPGEWERVHATISAEIDRAVRLYKVGGRIGKAAGYIWHELLALARDLSAWDPDERVCYGEFWIRIKRYKAALDRLETLAQATHTKR